jgi:hypothetical protein
VLPAEQTESPVGAYAPTSGTRTSSCERRRAE